MAAEANGWRDKFAAAIAGVWGIWHLISGAFVAGVYNFIDRDRSYRRPRPV